MAVILAVNMLVIGIFGSYQTAQAAEIVAGYGAAQILESILLSFGISIFTADMIKNGSNATWWDTDGSAALKPYYDDLEQAYEEQRFKVINGGGGQDPQPSPTPAPGNTPIPFPTTAPVPGDIPTFKELVAPALAGTAAVINMTQGAWECMAKAVSSFWDKIISTDTSVSNDTNPYAYKDLVAHVYARNTFEDGSTSTFNYYLYSSVADSLIVEATANSVGVSMYLNGKVCESSQGSLYKIVDYNPGKPETHYTYAHDRTVGVGQHTGYSGCTGITYSYDCYLPYILNGVAHDAELKPLSKEEIWVHPDLQDTYKIW